MNLNKHFPHFSFIQQKQPTKSTTCYESNKKNNIERKECFSRFSFFFILSHLKYFAAASLTSLQRRGLKNRELEENELLLQLIDFVRTEVQTLFVLVSICRSVLPPNYYYAATLPFRTPIFDLEKETRTRTRRVTTINVLHGLKGHGENLPNVRQKSFRFRCQNFYFRLLNYKQFSSKTFFYLWKIIFCNLNLN